MFVPRRRRNEREERGGRGGEERRLATPGSSLIFMSIGSETTNTGGCKIDCVSEGKHGREAM